MTDSSGFCGTHVIRARRCVPRFNTSRIYVVCMWMCTCVRGRVAEDARVGVGDVTSAFLTSRPPRTPDRRLSATATAARRRANATIKNRNVPTPTFTAAASLVSTAVPAPFRRRRLRLRRERTTLWRVCFAFPTALGTRRTCAYEMVCDRRSRPNDRFVCQARIADTVLRDNAWNLSWHISDEW